MDVELMPASTGFDELLESRLFELLERMRSTPIAEVEEELNSLSKVVNEYRLNDELLENFLSHTTPQYKSQLIQETLRRQATKVKKSAAELQRLHEKSHSILEHSAQLLAKIDRQLYELTHKNSDYAPEICANCGGIGSVNCKMCISCNGRRTILVHQPSIKCPRCVGTGRSGIRDRLDFSQYLCVICRGRGWVLILDQ